MKQQAVKVRIRPVQVLIILLLFAMLLTWQIVSGSSACQVEITVVGMLQNERGEPMGGEELLFSFYVHPEKKDVEILARTGTDGSFRLQASVPQSVYENTGLHCVELQGRVFLKDYQEDVDFQPGAPNTMSTVNDYAEWAAAGRYEGGEIQLFHSLRVQEDTGGPPEFADFSIQLGSEQEPCLLQIGKLAKAEREFSTHYLRSGTGEPLASSEIHTHRENDPATYEFIPKAIAEMAPLIVEAGGELLAEAERGSPIDRVDVAALAANHSQAEPLDIVIYYHPDRDGDGVPDYLVTEQFLDETGQPLLGQPEQTQLLAHRDTYQGRAPSVRGYQYQGYQQPNEPLRTGEPEIMITADGLYQFIYVRQNTGGGGKPGSNGSNKEDPPPEEENKDGQHRPEEEIPPDLEGAGEAENPEPEPPAPEETEDTQPDDSAGDGPVASGEDTNVRSQTLRSAGAPAPTLTAEEREARRNVTFVKLSYRQEAEPGEEITYGFQGFENAFPYPLREFTIVDKPDPGLDLVSIELPAFQQGAGLTYQIAYTTNEQGERNLGREYPADQRQYIEPPTLKAGEHITTVTILLAEVPAGFGEGDEIRFTFRVWDEPPKDTLHNLGYLYYEELDALISVQSGTEDAQVTIRTEKRSRTIENEREETAGKFSLHGGKKRLSDTTNSLFLLAAVGGITAGAWKKKRK